VNFLKLYLITLLISSLCYAFEVDVELKPKEPIKNQPFELIFKIKTDSKKDAYISFNAGSMDVLGKNKQGEMIRTTFVNGRLSTIRDVSYSYDIVANKVGFFRIGDVSVELDGTTTKLPGINVKVLETQRTKAPVFLAVETNKDQYYVGEPIEVNYYLYHRYRVSGMDIVKFPKLSGFLKRFKTQGSRSEKITRAGVLYERTPIYSGTLFANKMGPVKLDSMTMRVQYMKSSNRNDPFGGFGFGFSRPQTRNITNPSKEIEILPLPEKGRPDGFNGLVGEHIMSVQINKNKFLVNEAIELKFSINGKGALEHYELPSFYQSSALEKFESNSDFKPVDGGRSTKTFDLTYLARSAESFAQRREKLYYFDPEDKAYKFTEFQLPSIEIIGSASSSGTGTQSNTSPQLSELKENVDSKQVVAGSEVLGPRFVGKIPSKIIESWLNILLGLILVVLVVLTLSPKKSSQEQIWKQITSRAKSNEIHYGDMNRLLTLKGAEQLGRGPKHIIENSSLPDNAKDYFIDLIEKCEIAEYKDSAKVEMKYEEQYFKELQKVILG
jgi:hypothetical protein